MSEAQQAMDTREVTHIEIRRVQNGFVVMAVDYRRNYSYDTGPVQRCSFVAQDVSALQALIGSIVDMAEVKWLPTADVPMLEMERRVARDKQREEEEELVKKVAQRAAHIMAAPPVMAAGGQSFGYAPNQIIGGPLNKVR